jgi:hypothetical protein
VQHIPNAEFNLIDRKVAGVGRSAHETADPLTLFDKGVNEMMTDEPGSAGDER